MRTRPGASGPSNTSPGASPVHVTVVESEACHFCVDAHRVLLETAARYPVEVRTVDVRSAEGGELMQKHRATMSPLVLVDGAFFSTGRLPRRKLAHVLAQRFAAPTAGDLAARGGANHG